MNFTYGDYDDDENEDDGSCEIVMKLNDIGNYDEVIEIDDDDM